VGLCKDGYWRETETYEGKQYVGSGKDQKSAMKNLAQKILDAKTGNKALNKSTTVKAWSDTWLEVYVKPKVRKPGQPKSKNSMTEKSYSMYTQNLSKHILPAIGFLKLKDVKDAHLQKILNSQAGTSASHVEKIRIVIKAMFRQAYISRLLAFDPSSNLTLPAVQEHKRRSITDEERELLLQACGIHRCGLWIKLLLATGIRPGESAPLLIKDFDFKKNLLNIDKDIESGTFSISDPKTKAGIRKIPIPEDMSAELQKAFESRSPFEYAFPQTNGKSMKSQECISNDWESFLRTMDVLAGAKTIVIRKTTTRSKDSPKTQVTKSERTISKNGYKATICGRIMTEEIDGENGSVLANDLVLYCLRHTFCTDLQKAGVPINIASYLMGHADIQTTANIYTHTGEDDALAAATNINAYRSKKQSAQNGDIKNVIKKSS
jgi:integrase